jgi:hypothetical protein
MNMRIFKWVLASVVFAALASCGGGSSCGDFATCKTGTGPNLDIKSISVVSSVATIPADGSAAATITATALNADNNAVSGATLTFSSNTGAIVVTSGTTSSNGVATATISANGAAAGTIITVTAANGSVSGKTTVQVISAQQTISLSASSPTLQSSGASTVTLTALVLGADNSLVDGAPVTFTATSGGLSPVSPIDTGSSGTAQVALSTASDPTNRAITVTATTGTATTTVVVNVIGSTISVTGPNNVSENTASTYDVTLLDSGGNPVANQPVVVTSAAGNPINGGTAGQTATVTTGSNGQVTFTMTPISGTAETLSVKALSTTVGAVPVTASESVSISTDNFSFTVPAANSTVDLGASQTVTVQWLNNDNPVANGTTVNFSTTRGLFGGTAVSTTATTAGGLASVTISSTTAGPATITASGTDPATMAAVSATLPITFVAGTPTQLAIQANPNTVSTTAPNNQSTITATLRDVNNNLVAGQQVDFQLTDITGGNISAGSEITNAQGVAQVTYTASSTASANSNVTIKASVPAYPSIADQTVNLTVGGQSLFLSLGTGNLIQTPTTTTFSDPWVVFAIDSAGNPVANADITMQVQSVSYASGLGAWGMGSYYYSGTSYVQQAGPYNGGEENTPAAGPVVCLNEDENNNGIYDSSVDPGNGTLYPGSVAVVAPGSQSTDTNGEAQFSVIYPQSYAGWVQVVLTASTEVSGSQSSTSSTFWLPILASDLTTEGTPPPGYNSPFGTALTCPDYPGTAIPSTPGSHR